MNEKELLHLKHAITMPAGLADDLLQSCGTAGQKKNRHRHRAVLGAAAAVILCLCVGSTSLAYHVYQEKQLAVFMEEDLTQKEIEAIGSELSGLAEISSCRYVSGDEAWEEFQAAFLSGDPEAEALAASFPENPLAGSFNYQVSVRLGADTQAVREQLGALPGVRKITTVREAKAEAAGRPDV